ncbi:hypothetical protein QA600_01825 [Natronococcus sp. A-GB1]|uniref:hypothetical protein n=1 Tax=Natronococcus sp. A-GB1 TaxID=3037648 RepID=UPI00241D2152|nr:hypothetical protein [Natronococcus sp. A-GB1]MDG5758074.1 hypothetical protein [Natronococcus sp. A-GB1]
MNSTRSAALLAAVLLVGLTVAPVASGAFASVGADDRSDEQDDEQHDSEVERGVTTFMQSSATDTSSTVESEMFEAKYEAADDDVRERLVDERADGLEAQLESLEYERDELREHGNELSTPQYQARMTRLTVEIVALERAIEQTIPFADDKEVGVDRLEVLEENVVDLGSEQIAAVATELLGFEGYLEGEPVDDGGDETDAADGGE